MFSAFEGFVERSIVTSRCFGLAVEEEVATFSHPPHAIPATTEACITKVAIDAIAILLLGSELFEALEYTDYVILNCFA